MAQTVAAGAVFPRLQCSYRPLLQNGLRSREARLFCWFEPMDKAAVDYSLVITKRTDLAADWPAASLVVLLSIVVHRTTTTPYAKSRIPQSAEWTQESLKIWNIAMRRLLKVFPPRRLRGHPAARRIR